MMAALDRIREQVAGNPVMLYMKGTPQMPQCGFSSRIAQALMECGEEFAYVNILLDPEVRAELPKFAGWPTFPQLYIRGELVGGCDIAMDLHQPGKLQELVRAAHRAD